MSEDSVKLTLEVKQGDKVIFAFEKGENVLLTHDAELNSQVLAHLGAAQEWLKESSTHPTGSGGEHKHSGI